MSQVWAFWAPPCSNTSSGGDEPQRRALTASPSGPGIASRSTTGGSSNARPASAALSASIENSS